MRTGLRTEIVVSICLLLGAALMFAGFLLVKLTEQELLAQRLQQVRVTTGLLRQVLTEDRYHLTGAAPLAGLQSSLPDLFGWRLLDSHQRVVAGMMTNDLPPFDTVPALAALGESFEDINYSSGWLPWQEAGFSYVDLSLPVSGDVDGEYLLQVRFSLRPLVERVHRAQRLVLAYVVTYGLVLCLFGIYLLHRNLVQPIRRLQQATAQVASGSLVPLTAADGPVEIVDLSNSFNQMIGALELSRIETETHIRSLEAANLALEKAGDQLVRSEKMATVGHLAAGMAHEVGNPLAALVGYLGVLSHDLENETQKDLVDRCQSETGRIDKLIRELLDYASPSAGAVEAVDPVAVLRETVAMLRHQGMLDRIVIDDRCGQTFGEVMIDPHRLQQVWVNLLLNARDAMGGNGKVWLGGAIEGEQFVVSIGDGGAGIPAAQIGMIFEPFYTTKDPGKGRGLGLAVCQRIIDAAGGRIEVRSDASGTVFRVCLPLGEFAQPASELV